MTYSDIKTLPLYVSEMLSEIMVIEEQHQQKELNKQVKKQSRQKKKHSIKFFFKKNMKQET